MGLEPARVIACVPVISLIRTACCTYHQLESVSFEIYILVIILPILDMVLSHDLDLSVRGILFPLKI